MIKEMECGTHENILERDTERESAVQRAKEMFIHCGSGHERERSIAVMVVSQYKERWTRISLI